LSVTVNIHQALRQITNNQATVEVAGTTVGECLTELVQRFPEIKSKLFGKNGKLLNYIDIYVNAESAYPEELAKPVKNGDKLSITLMLAGG
jgi:molybdopterin converting factor small subunit